MKKLLLSALLLLSCLCLTGCQLTEALQTALTDNALALVAEKAEETRADALTRQFLDGVLAGDAEACLAAMTEIVCATSTSPLPLRTVGMSQRRNRSPQPSGRCCPCC
ncbi:MAG: hypothetical protein IJ343_06970 [Clostridia bacterium]|nr:hypothetical protein [Clostridia bacterium]